eukprot:403361198
MVQILKTILLLSAVISVSNQAYLGKNEQGIDVFTIQMSGDPKQRFVEPALKYQSAIKALITDYQQFIPSIAQKMFEKLDWIVWYFHEEHYYEIQGMAEAAGIETHLAVMLNFVYEFDSYCTSLIARLSNGQIVHQRNLDFYFADHSRELVYIAKFYRGDQYLYDGVFFGGIVATYTAYKEGSFAITLNQRSPSHSKLELAQNIARIFMGYTQSGWAIRDALATCHNYDCAVSKLSTEPHVAPSYLIISGIKDNEGIVITRDREATAHVEELSDTQWYLVQTNQDHYNGDCPIRCQHARQTLDLLGPVQATSDSIYQNVLQTWPNLNFMSIHSARFQAAQNSYSVDFIYAKNMEDPGDL